MSGESPAPPPVDESLRDFLESMPDAIVGIDAAGRIVCANRETEKMFGYTREDLLGRPVEVLVPDRLKPHHAQYRDGYFEHPRTRPMGVGLELFARRRDGTEFPVEISLGTLPTSNGPIAMSAIRDITRRKKIEEELERASRMKSEFLTNMSHELRTPLNAVIGFSELLHDGKAGAVSERQREFLADVLTNSRHLLRLIEDVLDLARIEAGRSGFRPEAVDVAALTVEALGAVAGDAAKRRIALVRDVDPALEGVVADPTRLRQVLLNFLSNALKFTGDGGRIVVRVLAEPADRFRIEVEDSGIGISPEDVERLFVAFQQLDSSASKRYPGTGLGLALTKRIVEEQGGAIGVRSAPGKGSVFFAVLPRLAGTSARAAGGAGA